MLSVSTAYTNAIKAKVRRMKAKVDYYSNYALAATYTQNDRIKSIEIQRVGAESKFFGFGISHRLNLKLIDVNRELNITTSDNFLPMIGIETADGVVYSHFPQMYVSEVNRDENTNELSITAYDILENFKNYTVSQLALTTPYTIGDFIIACGNALGIPTSIPEGIEAFTLSYADGANFEGTESLYDALVAAAEATQTIFYINASGILTFKRLDIGGDAALTITRNDYLTLDSSNNRRLQTICSATELGDNVSASTTQIGTTQYVRDNPFWELREDVNILVDNALAAVGNMTINQFNCEWRGNPALEIGDKIALVTKDNQTIVSYLLNDTLTYDGSLKQTSEWNYTDSEESESNPTNLGDALKQTFARVDKANKQVNILVSQVEANSENLSSLQLNTETIAASVKALETNTSDQIDSLNGDVSTLTKQVSAKMTAEEVKLEIQSELANGVSKVETNTGFTFDDTGLTVSKTGSEMETTITEDGMTVYKDKQEMLVANNEGVNAVNLHATTYLIIGNNSRLEDYEIDGEARTACFWIG